MRFEGQPTIISTRSKRSFSVVRWHQYDPLCTVYIVLLSNSHSKCVPPEKKGPTNHSCVNYPALLLETNHAPWAYSRTKFIGTVLNYISRHQNISYSRGGITLTGPSLQNASSQHCVRTGQNQIPYFERAPPWKVIGKKGHMYWQTGLTNAAWQISAIKFGI